MLRMSFLGHLEELRSRLLKMLAGMGVAFMLSLTFCQEVWNVVAMPAVDALNKLGIHPPTLKAITPMEQFNVIWVKLPILCSIFIASPWILYQVWAFISPGLYKRERRWAYYFVGAAIPLFAIGATIAYFAMTKGLRFLLHLVPAHTTALITINTYLSYAGAMLLIFGLAFELPLVFVLLNMAGVLTHARFRKWRRMIIFLVFAFAAIFTPSPDPISMLLLAVPCVVLVEASEIFAWANDRRRAKRGSLAFPGLTEAEVAAYGLDTPLGEPSDAGLGAPH
jgi:sec-independent protein translocase protein TatC